MPEAYETLRDEFIGQGMDVKDAMRKAARIFNANRADGEPPVGRGYGKKIRKPRRKRRLRR